MTTPVEKLNFALKESGGQFVMIPGMKMMLVLSVDSWAFPLEVNDHLDLPTASKSGQV